jgi:hypothetical protein
MKMICTGIAVALLMLLTLTTNALAAPLTIETALLADGGVDAPYTQAFTASGGTAPYTWKGTGILPPGLSVSTDGIISGTPTSTGNYNFIIKLTDSTPTTVTRELFLNITSHAIAMPAVKPAEYNSCTSCHTSGTPDVSKPVTTISSKPPLTSTSPDATFEFFASKSAVTFECSLDGTPLASCITPVYYSGLPEGFHTFRVRATDSLGNIEAAPASYTWNYALPQPLSITTVSLPSGTVGTPYNQTLTVANGETPFRWASSTLPDGLFLNWRNGIVSGTPTTIGTYSIDFQVTDNLNTVASKTLSLIISASDPGLITIPGLPGPFTSIQEAYAQVPNGGTIKLRAGTFTENLVFNRAISFTLKGGYDDTFTTNTGITVIAGTVTVQSGTVTIDNITVQ